MLNFVDSSFIWLLAKNISSFLTAESFIYNITFETGKQNKQKLAKKQCAKYSEIQREYVL